MRIVPSMMNPSTRGYIFTDNLPSITDQVTHHAIMKFTILFGKIRAKFLRMLWAFLVFEQ